MICLAATACSEDTADAPLDQSCAPHERFNPITSACEPERSEPPAPDAGDTFDDADHGGSEDVSAPNNSDPSLPDTGAPDDPIPADCDRDGDGHLAVHCGGGDCDDDDPYVYPGQIEACGFKDDNCNGEVNEGLDCTFYAHTATQLYRIDPFQRTATPLGDVPSNTFDIDTHPDGTLYAISSNQLYRLPVGSTRWETVGSMGSNIGNANGLCIDSGGRAYATVSSSLYWVNLQNAQVTYVGATGHTSSGDCVINKADTLFMSATGRAGLAPPDNLVILNGSNGQATVIGATNHRSIYALTAAWGFMFGLTGAGELIRIDTNTGRSETLHTFSHGAWNGAASTPGR